MAEFDPERPREAADPPAPVSPVLDYQADRRIDLLPGATRAARVIAVIASLLFLLLTLSLTLQMNASDDAWPFVPGLAVALAGSAFCGLVAAGKIGKHQRAIGRLD